MDEPDDSQAGLGSVSEPDAPNALVLVDVQAAFLIGDYELPDAGQLIRALSVLLAKARRANALIVHLQNDAAPGEIDEPYTPGWRLCFGTEPSPNELVIRKTGDDGFADTPLDEVLRRRGVTRLVIGGLLSEMCVSATARTALAKSYRVVLPRDAHGTYNLGEIPAAVVARVAEHALGDAVELVGSSAEVRFRAVESRTQFFAVGEHPEQ